MEPSQEPETKSQEPETKSQETESRGKKIDILTKNTSQLPDIDSDITIKDRNSLLPTTYNAPKMNRAMIVRLGYNQFSREGNVAFFQGKKIGETIYNLKRFLKEWMMVHDKIQHPVIYLSSFNENWGLLSGLFPNRTINWTDFPTPMEYIQLRHFLNHPSTLLLLTNQHSNVTHPKLLTLPRGLPIHTENNRRLLWDSMYQAVQQPTKHIRSRLAFVASSNWGYRPTLKSCLLNKLNNTPGGFYINSYQRDLQGRLLEKTYYQELLKTKISIALPGLGYDTFR
jgi:hypothetical protein